MPFCPACGKEIEEDVTFCPNCGENIKEPEARYVRPSRRDWNVSRVLALAFGGIILLASVGILVGGGAIFWVYYSLEEADGFLISREFDVEVDSYAIVFKGLEVEMNTPANFWIERTDELISVKVIGASNVPSNEVFLGIAGVADASNYLRNVEYHEVEEFRWSFDQMEETPPEIKFSIHQGDSPSGPPIIHSFWIEHATGRETQILEWETSLASFQENIKDLWIIVMNADGSSNIDIKIQIGVKIPILKTVRSLLLTGGFITLILGSLIIYFRVVRQRH
jgi:predicted nucleic acid-binding Zn ribbon protein